jgi:hypothetical protein
MSHRSDHQHELTDHDRSQQTHLPTLTADGCMAWAARELPAVPTADEHATTKRCASLMLVTYLARAFPEWYVV